MSSAHSLFSLHYNNLRLVSYKRDIGSARELNQSACYIARTTDSLEALSCFCAFNTINRLDGDFWAVKATCIPIQAVYALLHMLDARFLAQEVKRFVVQMTNFQPVNTLSINRVKPKKFYENYILCHLNNLCQKDRRLRRIGATPQP